MQRIKSMIHRIAKAAGTSVYNVEISVSLDGIDVLVLGADRLCTSLTFEEFNRLFHDTKLLAEKFGVKQTT